MKVQMIRNALEDDKNQSGLGYYAEYLESQMIEQDLDYTKVCFEINLDKGFKALILDNLLKPSLQVLRASKETDIVHAIAEHCSIFFPFTRSKRVLTFHHVVRPGEAGLSWDIIWHLSVFIAKRFTDWYIAISPQTKEEMVRVLKIPEDRITVITHPHKSSICRREIPKEDLLIFVGTLCDRKRPLMAIDAFDRIRKTDGLEDHRLIICGDGPMRPDVERRINELGLGGSVQIVSNVTEDELCNLYNRGKILLNTSKLEGLGLTTLEAQACGAGVLYLEDAEMPEEVMAAALCCEDLDDVVAKAAALLKNHEEMENVANRGLEYASSFKSDYGKKLMEVYKNLL